MSGAALINASSLKILREAAEDKTPVKGLTHNFYRYPARFSPNFVSTAIKLFSKPGQLVLDPYMGGGTTVVEAAINGRRAVGNDLNELSTFIARVKTCPLSQHEQSQVRGWIKISLPRMSFRYERSNLEYLLEEKRTHNLSLPSARPLKKALAGALSAIDEIDSPKAKAFSRCVLLRLGQLFLDGRKTSPSLDELRRRLPLTCEEMLEGLRIYQEAITSQENKVKPPKLITGDAAKLNKNGFFSSSDNLVDLVVTSPPYPGVHLLYHRWQVNGRRETPAPYWLSGTQDGHGASYYNFADRKGASVEKFFETSLRTLCAIRNVMKEKALFVQMIAFNSPELHLPKYLKTMNAAGFFEVSSNSTRIWRKVPGRRWHAAMKGDTSSSKEVVLIHQKQ